MKALSFSGLFVLIGVGQLFLSIFAEGKLQAIYNVLVAIFFIQVAHLVVKVDSLKL